MDNLVTLDGNSPSIQYLVKRISDLQGLLILLGLLAIRHIMVTSMIFSFTKL